MLAGVHVRQDPLQPVATRLKTVKTVEQKIPFLMLIRPRGQQPVRRRLNKPGDVNRVAERQRRIHHPHLHGAKMRAGANIPVQIFDAVDHAGGAQAAEQPFELLPAVDPRHLSVIREPGEDIEPRRGELRVRALHVRRGGRQGNKVRYKARQAVQEVNGVIPGPAADVHVLAEYRRLQNQIAKALQRDVIALVVAHLLTLPLLERVRSAAADLDVMLRRRAQDALLHHRELRRCLVDGLAHAGGDFEHAFGDIVFDFAPFDVVFDGGDSAEESWLRS